MNLALEPEPEAYISFNHFFTRQLKSNLRQVTKDGKMAGSNKLRHMVDQHLHLAVENKDEDLKGCRVLETVKNRFGGCGHVVFMKLRRYGFSEVARITGD